jgi:hypothetical protein
MPVGSCGLLLSVSGRTFQGVFGAFLDHAEHELYQFFEEHFTIPGELLCSFFRPAFIFLLPYEPLDCFTTYFFHVIYPSCFPGYHPLGGLSRP